MTSRDFCYWLQGFFELSDSGRAERQLGGFELSDKQSACIRRHLAMVFTHEIDPSFGPKSIQDALTKIHSGQVGSGGITGTALPQGSSMFNC